MSQYKALYKSLNIICPISLQILYEQSQRAEPSVNIQQFNNNKSLELKQVIAKVDKLFSKNKAVAIDIFELEINPLLDLAQYKFHTAIRSSHGLRTDWQHLKKAIEADLLILIKNGLAQNSDKAKQVEQKKICDKTLLPPGELQLIQSGSSLYSNYLARYMGKDSPIQQFEAYLLVVMENITQDFISSNEQYISSQFGVSFDAIEIKYRNNDALLSTSSANNYSFNYWHNKNNRGLVLTTIIGLSISTSTMYEIRIFFNIPSARYRINRLQNTALKTVVQILKNHYIPIITKEIGFFLEHYHCTQSFNEVFDLVCAKEINDQNLSQILPLIEYFKHELRLKSTAEQSMFWRSLLKHGNLPHRLEKLYPVLIKTLDVSTLKSKEERLGIYHDIACFHWSSNYSSIVTLLKLSHNLDINSLKTHILCKAVFKLMKNQTLDNKHYENIIALLRLTASAQATQNTAQYKDLAHTILEIAINDDEKLSTCYGNLDSCCQALNNCLIDAPELLTQSYKILAEPLKDTLERLEGKEQEIFNKEVVINRLNSCLSLNKHIKQQPLETIFLGVKGYILNHLGHFHISFIGILLSWSKEPMKEPPILPKYIATLTSAILNDYLHNNKVTTDLLHTFSRSVKEIVRESPDLLHAYAKSAITIFLNTLAAEEYKQEIWHKGLNGLSSLFISYDGPDLQARFKLIQETYNLHCWQVGLSNLWVNWIRTTLMLGTKQVNNWKEDFATILFEGNIKIQSPEYKDHRSTWRRALKTYEKYLD